MSDVMREVAQLVDAWCERRCLRALREMLGGMPIDEQGVDEWADVRDALVAVRAYAAHELTEDELASVERLIGEAGALVLR
jgi:hypothetical protein